MSINFVFRNYDLKAIRDLLKEIGKERYECALKDMGIEDKPIVMNGFYVEYETESRKLSLYYRYPIGATFFIMSVLGYWAVPTDNWKMETKVIR